MTIQKVPAGPGREASPGAQPAVCARGLRKSFGDQVVLDGIDLEVAEGTIFALLGPNGSGKTTTVRILSTLITADAGAVKVAGHDLAAEPGKVRAAIGVTGQFSAVDGYLTGEENLLLMADLHHLSRAQGKRRAAELLDQFDLAEAGKKIALTYSGGMRRRLDLAMTLVGNPRLIFLDEPTAGLDPRSRRTMWEIIADLAASGVTIFLTTQYLEEADQLADQIAVLDHGQLVAQGTADELKRLIAGGHVLLRFGAESALDQAAALFGSAAARDDEALTLQIPSDGGVRSLKELLDLLDSRAIAVETLTVHTPDLDDVFLAITGHDRETDQDQVSAQSLESSEL
jgi:ABC-2 type transport system ATP-binding protein